MNTEAPSALQSVHVGGLALAASLVPLNSTMIAVALPDMADDFGITTGRAGIVVTIYLVVMLVGQPMMGRLIDVSGGVRVLRLSLLGFAAASIGTAFATGFPVVVAGRAVQAGFGAALMPASQTLLRSLTEPERRGRSFGMLGSFIGAGAAAGPVIGGLVTELGGWRGIFLVNVPLAWAAILSLVNLPSPRASTPKSTQPGVGVLRVLTQRTFGAAFLTQAASTFGQYSLLLVVPAILDTRGWTSTQVGAALTALTAGIVLMGPAGGRVGDRRGRRWPVVAGVGVAALASILAAQVAETSSLGLVVAITIFGFGLGFAMPSVQTAALESVPEEVTGSTAGVLSMSRYVGSIPASLLLGALVSEGGDGSRTLLAIAAVFMAVATLCATKLPGRAQ